MFYRARIQIAAIVSLLIHVAALAFLPYLANESRLAPVADAKERPIVLTLNKTAATDQIPRLIESGAPAEEPVAETDLISDADSQAQDDSEIVGDTNRPHVDEIDDFDEMPTPATPPPGSTPETIPEDPSEAQAQAETPPLEQEDVSERTPEPIADAEALTETTTAAADVTTPIPDSDASGAVQTITLMAETTADPESPSAELEDDEPKPEPAPAASVKEEDADAPEKAEEAEEVPERFEVAQAVGTPSVEPQEVHVGRGRESGGADKSGFTSFEANKHEMGEYMLSVRRAVERQWRAGLQLRYSGVTRTSATIECSIRPDGSVEFARILESGGSMSYAILCREAILRAAPYGPFPFDVPDIYREKNLEIVWKFSFM